MPAGRNLAMNVGFIGLGIYRRESLKMEHAVDNAVCSG